MKLSSQKVKKFAKQNGMSLKELLDQSGVSKTTYYHLTKKKSLLPKSVQSLAKTLKVSPARLLEARSMEQGRASQKAVQKVHRLRKRLARILEEHPEVDPQNAWHTLLLLELPPWERLQRGLLRAQKYHFH